VGDLGVSPPLTPDTPPDTAGKSLIHKDKSYSWGELLCRGVSPPDTGAKLLKSLDFIESKIGAVSG